MKILDTHGLPDMEPVSGKTAEYGSVDAVLRSTRL
jgi:hypothetical protein